MSDSARIVDLLARATKEIFAMLGMDLSQGAPLGVA
jgi:hypothetical protein